MLQTEEMGSALFSIYNDGTDYSVLMERVKNDMVANQKVISKNRKILTNLSEQMLDIDVNHKMFLDLSKQRDADKKKYEHYRTKLNKLREKEAKN